MIRFSDNSRLFIYNSQQFYLPRCAMTLLTLLLGLLLALPQAWCSRAESRSNDDTHLITASVIYNSKQLTAYATHRTHKTKYAAGCISSIDTQLRSQSQLSLPLQMHLRLVSPDYDALPNSAFETCCLSVKNEMSQYRGYFVPGATDPSGRLAQKFKVLKNGKCGTFNVQTEWVLEEGEKDGYIVQFVTINVVNPKPCRDLGQNLVFETPNLGGNLPGNQKTVKKNGGTYVEVWRVVGGIVYGSFKVGPNAASNLDNFANFGTGNNIPCSKSGKSTQLGEAIFISDGQTNNGVTVNGVNKPFEKWLFTGKRGVINAFDLPSTNLRPAKLYSAIKLQANVPPGTTKLVKFDWNCCKKCQPLANGEPGNNCDKEDTNVELFIDGASVKL